MDLYLLCFFVVYDFMDWLFADGLAEWSVVEIETPFPAVSERTQEGTQGAVHRRPLERRQVPQRLVRLLLRRLLRTYGENK